MVHQTLQLRKHHTKCKEINDYDNLYKNIRITSRRIEETSLLINKETGKKFNQINTKMTSQKQKNKNSYTINFRKNRIQLKILLDFTLFL